LDIYITTIFLSRIKDKGINKFYKWGEIKDSKTGCMAISQACFFQKKTKEIKGVCVAAPLKNICCK
jgi:hypothetical protein